MIYRLLVLVKIIIWIKCVGNVYIDIKIITIIRDICKYVFYMYGLIEWVCWFIFCIFGIVNYKYLLDIFFWF